ncbi:MAG: hypothetical protein ACREO7_00945 [Pseudoxanthomonas sp.]
MNIATNDFSSFTAGTELAPLTGLSLQHTWPGVTPAAPSNEDRARAFRNAQPVALANHFPWPFQHPADAQPAAAGSVAVDGKPARRLSLVQAA